MRLGILKKAPEDRADGDFNFELILPDGDSITDADAEADDGLTVEAVSIYGMIVKVWVSGGEAGKSYKLNVVVTTAQARIKEACLSVRVIAC